MMKITVLGCGTSMGVPMMGCRCPVCLSPNPRNRRARPAIMVEVDATRLLIDTPPELRLQLIQYGLDDRLDAVLITHTHADHIMGMDDIRGYTLQTETQIPVYAEPNAIQDLERVFLYVAHPFPPGSSSPLIRFLPIEGDSLTIGSAEIRPLRVYHGEMPILAFRIGAFAYVTDTNLIPEESMAQLMDLDFLILGALRYQEHPTHFNLEQAIEVARLLQPKRVAFTHLTHDFDYETVNAELPPGMELAYDGMIVEMN